jgi:hypothetical protein
MLYSLEARTGAEVDTYVPIRTMKSVFLGMLSSLVGSLKRCRVYRLDILRGCLQRNLFGE